MVSYSTLHAPGGQYGAAQLAASQNLWDSAWHKWGCYWTGTSVEMYRDEVLYWTTTQAEVEAAGLTWEFEKEQCPFLSIYVGGPAAGPPSADTPWPVSMVIDWVRCYSAVPYAPLS